jgi:sigma-B regulation protein RsbU (phosphoserine phosphatase)
MASSMVKVMYRKIIEKPDIMPHEVLEDMNRTVFEIFDFAGKDNYLVFTAFVGIIEDDTFYYANAGQPYPLMFNAKQERFTQIEQNGFVIGMLDGIAYKTDQTTIAEGDCIFLYTDGLFCSGEGSEFSGWHKVMAMSQNYAQVLNQDPESFLDEIFYGFHMIHKSKQVDFDDDVALMIIKKKSS